jgi:hypothetical protein
MTIGASTPFATLVDEREARPFADFGLTDIEAAL